MLKLAGQTDIRVFVSTTPFGALDRTPLEWLSGSGWRVAFNSTGRRLSSAEVANLAQDCDGIIAGTEDLSPLLDANPRLKVISRVGVGLDSVPLIRCRERNIAVAYTPDAVTPAVAELTVGLMLSVGRHVAFADRNIRKEKWLRSQGIRLGESCIGIIGFGRIGSAVAHLLAAFQPAEILVCDVLDKSRQIAALAAQGVKARVAALDDVLAQCDIVTLHVPLKASNRNLIGAEQLARMKPGAVLVNAARGGIVDESALIDVLRSGHLGGAAIDVYEHEPYFGPLAEIENVILTAHMGSCSVDCRAKMECDATADIISFFRHGTLANPVPADEYESQG